MAKRLSAYKGCLLGLAVGDAMGRPVNQWTMGEIREAYGPEGLRGFDCLNGYASVTAYTQIAAYAVNGLLLGLTRGQLKGEMAPYVRYICVAETEWARQQSYTRFQKPFFCWVGDDEVMKARRTRDNLLVDTLLQNRVGTMEEPRNKREGASALPAAVAVGMFYEKGRISREELRRLGAETVALTHGTPAAFLTGAALSHIVSRVLYDGESDLAALIKETIDVMHAQFSRDYSQPAGAVCQAMQTALSLSVSPAVSEPDAMEQLNCDDAAKVLAGALYACLMHPDDIEAALITAVNHSGKSSAVASVTGAILGAMLGDRSLREFFLPDLEPIRCLEPLAVDLYQGCPMVRGSALFDFSWDEKYVTYRR